MREIKARQLAQAATGNKCQFVGLNDQPCEVEDLALQVRAWNALHAFNAMTSEGVHGVGGC